MATNQEAMCTGEPPSKGHQELRHQNKHIMGFEGGWGTTGRVGTALSTGERQLLRQLPEFSWGRFLWSKQCRNLQCRYLKRKHDLTLDHSVARPGHTAYSKIRNLKNIILMTTVESIYSFI